MECVLKRYTLKEDLHVQEARKKYLGRFLLVSLLLPFYPFLRLFFREEVTYREWGILIGLELILLFFFFWVRSRFYRYAVWSAVGMLTFIGCAHSVMYSSLPNIYLIVPLPLFLSIWLFDKSRDLRLAWSLIFGSVALSLFFIEPQYFRKAFVNIMMVLLVTVIFNISRQYYEWLEQYRLSLLRTKNAEYRELIQQTFDGIAHLRDGVLYDVSDDFAAVFGYSAEQLEKKELKSLINFESVVSKVSEVRYSREGAESIFLQLLVHSSQGSSEIIAIRDITAQKQHQVQQSMIDRIEGTGTLAAGIAHEINTPLMIASVQNHVVLDWAQQADVSSRMLERMQIIQDELKRIGDIVKDLKWFVSSDASEPLSSVASSTKKVVQLAQHRIGTQVSISQNIEDSGLKISEQHFYQVVLNLLFNAAESKAEERSTVSIDISGSIDKDEYYVLVVSDDGKGIPKRLLSQVFDPFFTIDKEGGTGIGLSICQTLIKRVGGSITLDSSLVEGTTCTLRIPIHHHNTPTIHRRKANIQNILLVEDDVFLLTLVSEMLSDYASFQTTNIEEAYAMIQNHNIDCIICDVMMPGGGGMALYERLQKEDSLLLPYIIFITGGSTSHRTQQFLSQIPNQILYKPFHKDSLLSTLYALHGT